MNITTNAFIIETHFRTNDHDDKQAIIYKATYTAKGLHYQRESHPDESIVDFIAKVKQDIRGSRELFQSNDIVILDQDTYKQYHEQGHKQAF